ncbi:hypothetical protein PsorP6_005992 [Peronosclerospora sorghi]|uniref:Uncharacterized protein n=1 Tax=Peronosclerospora sorghi TaxID=230839 RepID=A0ACC0W630_9STRA|nr:hypothetical protein PsorP6_005992 [Peronosclerospora sorghi]
MKCFEESLNIRRTILEPGHPDIALTKNNLAYAKKETRVYDETITLYEQVLLVRKQVIGLRHHDTIMAHHNVVEAYRSSGDEDKAVNIQHEILALLDVASESSGKE